MLEASTAVSPSSAQKLSPPRSANRSTATRLAIARNGQWRRGIGWEPQPFYRGVLESCTARPNARGPVESSVDGKDIAQAVDGSGDDVHADELADLAGGR